MDDITNQTGEMEGGAFNEKRRDERIPIDSILFPFLGSREEDHVCFEYLPLNISLHGLCITIPQWLVSREHLEVNDLIHLHIPLQLDRGHFDMGEIVWTRWDEASQAQVCGIRLGRQTVVQHPVWISLESRDIRLYFRDFASAEDVLLSVLKELFLLKKGVLIYLNHLIPYFSRIGKYPSEDYPMLKEVFLEDVRSRVKDHQEKLEALYDEICQMRPSQSDMARNLDLEGLRALVESELYMEILKATFESETALRYLRSIKDLEEKLYFNYNIIVLLYIRSLQSRAPESNP